VVFIISYPFLLEYYRKEDFWENTKIGDDVIVRYKGIWQHPKKVVSKEGDQIKIQHFGTTTKEEFISHLKKDPYKRYKYYLEIK
jgi:hypothetical protein